MPGLLDYLNGDTSDAGAMDPRMMGLLGMAGAMGSAYTPQPASRLPTARPNMANMLGLAAGGYGQGYGQGLKEQMIPAQIAQMKAMTTGQNLQNQNAVDMYNMWAPYLGKPQMGADPSGGGTVSPGPMPQPQGGAPAGPAPQMPAPSAMGGAGMAPGPVPTPNLSGAAPVAPSSPPAGGGLPSMADLYKLPPPLLQKMGITVPPELVSAYAAGMAPGSAEWNNLARNAAIKASGVAPVIGGERPGVLPSYMNPATGKYEADLGQLGPMQAGAAAAARGSAEGALPSKEAEAAYNAGLKVNTENEIEKRKSFYQTGIMPPGYGAQPVASPSGAIATERGTVVPPAPPQPFLGTDAQIKQNENTAVAEKTFGQVRGTLDQTEGRMVALGNALKTVEGKGLNEGRAHAANILRGAGLNTAADAVMTAKDTNAVQIAMGSQTMDILGQLKAMNQGTGGRILNSEFVSLLDKQYGPNMGPEANHLLLSQALGGVYQTRNMIDDYYKYAKPGGWRDANAFQSAYYSKPENSFNTMVDQAGKALGPLKGMDSGPSQADYEFTAKKYGLTIDEVKRRMGGK